MNNLQTLLRDYKERLTSEPYSDYASHLVDCADLILDDLTLMREGRTAEPELVGTILGRMGREERMKNRNYMAFCKCGGLVAIARADTIQELTEHGRDAKKWEKKGFRVELREARPDESMPEWCKNPKCGTCGIGGGE